MNSPGHEDFDTAWLAYCYVSGELAGVELARFEERLSTDQAARETVAEIVDLCAALEALPRQAFSPATSGARIWPAVGWMAVGAAACLALVLGLQSAPHGPGPQHALRDEADAANDRRLALSWTMQSWTRQSQPLDADESAVNDGPDAGSGVEVGEAESGEMEMSELDSNERQGASGLEPPSWVTAAIDESAKPAPPVNPNLEESP